ncbi:MAG: hypothetical protein J6X18_07335 [Bacteroidales bacterium]|nr:hypothetical protein [Bacteroidales bacterium]
MCDSEEYQKCLKSPAYFFNNYVRFLDRSTGAWIKPKPLTDEDFENAVNACKPKTRVRLNPYEVMANTLQWVKDNYKNEIIIITNDD